MASSGTRPSRNPSNIDVIGWQNKEQTQKNSAADGPKEEDNARA